MTAAGGPPLNIAQRLRDNAARWPERKALYYPAAKPGGAGGTAAYEARTFRQLDDESDAIAHGLARVGLGRGTRTILMVKPGPELFSILFALFKIGAVPVVVDPGMGVRRMLHSYAAVGADAFIGIPVAHIARVLFRKTFATLKTWVTVGTRRGWSGPTLDELVARARGAGRFPIAATGADDLLMINFTTGSTGPAKGVEYTHRVADAMVQRIASHFGHGPDDVTLAPLPLFALFDLLIGATAVLPPMDPTRPARVDAARMIDAIRTFQVDSLFASPAFLHRVGTYAAAHGLQLPSIKSVVSGGAPVSAAVVQSFRKSMAPAAELHVTYGATEALPIASIESRPMLGDALAATRAGAGSCVGRPLDGLDVRIVRISDDPMPRWRDDLEVARGEVGEIAIAGPIVSPSYHGANDWNARTKIADGDRVWHRTGDLGALDDDGRLWFAGRKSQRLATAQGPVYTVQWEEIFNGHPDVYRTALVGVGDGPAQRPVVCVELRQPASPERQREIEAELRALAAAQPVTNGADIAAFLFHRSFPVDIRHNAKIGREQLALWAAAALRERAPGARARRIALYAIPIGGWLFVGAGCVLPLGPLRPLWAIALFLSAVVHPLQLVVSLPLGRRAGYTTAETAFYTVLLGATWWKTLLPPGASPRAALGTFVERSLA